MKRGDVAVCAVVAVLGFGVYRVFVYTPPTPGVNQAALNAVLNGSPATAASPGSPADTRATSPAFTSPQIAANGERSEQPDGDHPDHTADARSERSNEDRPEHPGEAAYLRWQQRLSEDGTIPHDAMMTALRQR